MAKIVKGFSKLELIRDISISYIAGIASGVVIVSSTEGTSFIPKVFYLYLPLLWLFTILGFIFLTQIFRRVK